MNNVNCNEQIAKLQEALAAQIDYNILVLVIGMVGGYFLFRYFHKT